MRVAITGLAASRPQAEIAADITTSLEALLFAKRQDEGQRREVADPIDLDQRLRLRIRGLGQAFDLPVDCLIFTVISAI